MSLAELGSFPVKWSSPSSFFCIQKWAQWCKSHCGVQLGSPYLPSLWHGTACPPASPRQEALPPCGPTPHISSWDRDPSHCLRGAPTFRRGLQMPKPTRSACWQDLAVGFPIPRMTWICFLREWSSGRPAHSFDLSYQHSDPVMRHGLLGYQPAEVTALQGKKTNKQT